MGDVIVKKLYGPPKEVRTCGQVQVHKHGRVIADFIEAHGGIECTGVIDTRRVLSGTAVMLGPKSRFKGNLTAPGLAVKKGTRIAGGHFAMPDDRLGLTDLPGPN